MSYATLSDRAVTRLHLTVPPSGPWWATVELEGEVDLSGAVELVVGDLTLQGTIRRGGDFVGSSSYVVDAGAGGWREELPARGYSLASGVPMSVVLGDLAQETGETIAAGYTDRALGDTFARRGETGARVLDRLVGLGGWYVATDGTTAIGTRPSSAVAGQAFELLADKPAHACAEVAPSSVALLMPGAVVTIEDEDQTVGTLEVHVDPDRVRATLHFDGGGRDPLLVALAALTRRVQSTAFYGVHEYLVEDVSGDRLSLRSTDPTMPDLVDVVIHNAPGVTPEPQDGSRVLVEFINGQADRPYVSAFEAPDGQGFIPTSLKIEAGGGGLDIDTSGDLDLEGANVNVDATGTVAIDAGLPTATDAVNLGNATAIVIRDGDSIEIKDPMNTVLLAGTINLPAGTVPPLCSKVKA